MSEIYTPPEVRLGDMVYWYHDPVTMADPVIGWVCRRPGAVTVSVLAFLPDAGFVEKQSVRYKDDPGLRDNTAWRQWGCWDFSPTQKDLARAQQVTRSVAIAHEREAKKAHVVK